MKLLTSAADITKKIETIRKTGVSFQNAVQLAGVSIAAHVAQHRDKTLIEGLWDAMPNGSRRKTMADWFNHHVPGVTIVYKGEFQVVLAKTDSAAWKQTVEKIDEITETMADNPWHAHAKEKGAQDKPTLKAILAQLTRKSGEKSTMSDEEKVIVEAMVKLGKEKAEAAEIEV